MYIFAYIYIVLLYNHTYIPSMYHLCSSMSITTSWSWPSSTFSERSEPHAMAMWSRRRFPRSKWHAMDGHPGQLGRIISPVRFKNEQLGWTNHRFNHWSSLNFLVIPSVSPAQIRWDLKLTTIAGGAAKNRWWFTFSEVELDRAGSFDDLLRVPPAQQWNRRSEHIGQWTANGCTSQRLPKNDQWMELVRFQTTDPLVNCWLVLKVNQLINRLHIGY